MAKEANSGTSRKRHSPQYKSEALALAERIGVPAAAKLILPARSGHTVKRFLILPVSSGHSVKLL
ncbi:MAG: hypothetical protein HGA49_12345 [Eubacteriaceae bacterium]|nr:hypothetical protein [Eubacteriaceae bacterium]